MGAVELKLVIYWEDFPKADCFVWPMEPEVSQLPLGETASAPLSLVKPGIKHRQLRIDLHVFKASQ